MTIPSAEPTAERPDDVLTPDDVAAKLGLTKLSVVTLMAQGKIPAMKMGRRWRTRRDAVDACITAGIRPPQMKSRPDEETATWVYFFQLPSGHIKIGHAANVRKRLSQIQTAHVLPVEILGSFPAWPSTEARLHKEFASDRVRGEWFRPSRRLLKFISLIDENTRTIVDGWDA